MSQRSAKLLVASSATALLFFQPTSVYASRDVRTIDDPVYTAPKLLVDIEDGRRLNLYCTGNGKPVVVFDSGLGDSTKAWGLVQPEISKSTRACSYDRAGLGFSDPAREPSTSGNAVRDLHSLLNRAKLSPPYILVGHSYGGMNVKLFAETFPSEVIGMVLVEPSHEDVGKELFALDPDSHKRNLQYLDDLKRCLPATPAQLAHDPELTSLCVGQAGPRYSAAISAAELALAARSARISAWVSEMTHIWVESADQVRAAHRTLGSIPIVLITKPPSPPAPNEPKALREQKNKILSRLDDKTIGLSSRGRRITVEDTGHYIQLDQPAVVISAIQRTISESSEPPADAL